MPEFTQEQMDTAIAAAVLKSSDDLKTKFGTDKSEMMSDLKSAKEKLKSFDGVDVDKMKIMMGAFENDQDLKDIADGKHEDVIKRRMEKEKSEYTAKVTGLTDENEALTGTVGSLTQKVTDLMINSSVVSEFVKEKGLEGALPDVVLRAKSIFKVEGEDVIARDEKGEIITGAKGPMTITEWVTGLKKTAPHLFPGSSGSDTPGGGEPLDPENGLDAEIQAAIKAGDQKEYRRLRKKQKEGKK